MLDKIDVHCYLLVVVGGRKKVVMLKKINEEKTNYWLFMIMLDSFRDNGDNDVCTYDEQSMKYKNILTICTPWTHRTYELKRNIIGVEFNYEHEGIKWFSPKSYGITITREKHISIDWGSYTKNHENVGFSRYYTPFFTQRTRTTHNLLNIDGSMYDENQECCNEKLENQPYATFKAKDFDGEDVTIKAKLEYSRYTYFKNKLMRTITKLLRLDNEYYTVDVEFETQSGNGIGKRKGSWKGGVIGTSIDKRNKNETTIDAVKRLCQERNMQFVS